MGELPVSPLFSICVPTYNRAHLLDRLFANLAAVSGPTFELVIVDDGSDDGTRDRLEALAGTAPFPVQAISIPRGGQSRALNAAFDAAQGEFLLLMDDDDLLRPDALQVSLDTWNSIPEDERDGFCGLSGLCDYEDGRIVGGHYPASPIDSDFFTIRMVRNVRGDKKEVIRRAVLGDFRFEVTDGEYLGVASLIWFSLARTYRTRFINRVLATKGRRPEGITFNGRRWKVGSPQLMARYNLSLLRWFPRMPLWLKLRFYKDHMRYRLHAGDMPDAVTAQLPSPWLAALVRPAARAAARRDLRKLGRADTLAR